MTRRIGQMAVILVVLLVGLAGCGDDADGLGDGPTTVPPGVLDGGDEGERADELRQPDGPGARPGEGGAEASSSDSAAAIDACGLVTDAEVAAFVGAPVGPGALENPGSCRWAVSEPGGWARLVVIDHARYTELLDLGYVESEHGYAYDEANGSVLGLAVMGDGFGIQVGNTIPFFTGGDSPTIEAHRAFANAGLAGLASR